MAGLRKLIAGNWKMNKLTAEGRALAADIDAFAASADAPACDLLVCPPATILQTVAAQLDGSPVAVGGQNCHAEPSGAFTGEISAAMLADAGARYVILGHSERRHGLGETDAGVQAKVAAAHGAGLIAIVCIGETEDQRDAGQTLGVLSGQLAGSLPAADLSGDNTVIAYEPVWAIGTGKTATPEQAEAAHRHLRKRLAERYNPETANACRILYGGSVKPDNADSLLGLVDIDGALIGGASLKADSFLAIVASGIRASA